MSKQKTKTGIGKMILVAFLMGAIFAILGICLCIWFGAAAKPAVRFLRDASMYTSFFALFYYGGLFFALTETVIAACWGGYLNGRMFKHWFINIIIQLFAGIILSAILFITAPTKNFIISATASIAIVMQSFLIFFHLLNGEYIIH